MACCFSFIFLHHNGCNPIFICSVFPVSFHFLISTYTFSVLLRVLIGTHTHTRVDFFFCLILNALALKADSMQAWFRRSKITFHSINQSEILHEVVGVRVIWYVPAFQIVLSSLTANVCSRLLSSLVFLFSNLGCSSRSENISNAKQRPGLPCVLLFFLFFFNPYRTDQKVLLLPETDVASTNPTLIFHVLTFDFLVLLGGDNGGQLNLSAYLLLFFFLSYNVEHSACD